MAEPIKELVERATTHRGLAIADIELARSMAEAAAEEYLGFQEAEDMTLPLKRFSEARLLTALATGFGAASVGDAADAAYELCKATDDPTAVIQAIEGAIERL